MNLAKVSVFGLAVALVFALGAHQVWADDTANTISGKSSCGGCSGVVKGCCVMVTDADGAPLDPPRRQQDPQGSVCRPA